MKELYLSSYTFPLSLYLLQLLTMLTSDIVGKMDPSHEMSFSN